jgi:hypothetical protein
MLLESRKPFGHNSVVHRKPDCGAWSQNRGVTTASYGLKRAKYSYWSLPNYDTAWHVEDRDIIATWRLKTGIVDRLDVAFARQRSGKHVSAAKKCWRNNRGCYFLWCPCRSYIARTREKISWAEVGIDSRESEIGVGGQQSWAALLAAANWQRLRTTEQQTEDLKSVQ